MSRATLGSRVYIARDILVQPIGGEIVMLDVTREKYFGLDPVGTRIWELLRDHDRLDAVHAAMLAEYEVPPDRLEADLLELVDSLAEAGLVTVESADSGQDG